jgi:hypothetical protein
MNCCENLKLELIEAGLSGVQGNPELSGHLAGCPDCQALVSAYESLPGLLAALPDHEPEPELLSDTLAMVQNDAGNGPLAAGKPAYSLRQRWAGSLATIMLAFSVIALFPMLLEQQMPWTQDNVAMSPPPVEGASTALRGQGSSDRNGGLAGANPDGEVVWFGEEDKVVVEFRDPAGAEPAGSEQLQVKERVMPRKPRPAAREPMTINEEYEEQSPTHADGPVVGQDTRQLLGNLSEVSKNDKPKSPAGKKPALADPAPLADQEAPVSRSSSELSKLLDQTRKSKADQKREYSFSTRPAPPPEKQNMKTTDEIAQIAGARGAVSADSDDRDAGSGQYRPENGIVVGGKLAIDNMAGNNFVIEPPGEFFKDSRDESLVFQDPTGYWANTYVPGDPEIRLLNARLRQWERSGQGLGDDLDQAVAPYRQPFDTPTDNALALSLMADTGAAEGVTRMRLQVGLQAIEHRRGQRPSMNLAVVLDLPDSAGDGERIAARALLEALLDARQAGDRFSLVMAGANGGLRIPPDDFRHGPLQLVKNQIIGQLDNEANEAGVTVSLPEAMVAAANVVQEANNPDRPLGSSAIVLITAGSLSPMAELKALVHRQATDGIITSIIPLGPDASVSDVDEIVLAGLGHRRVLPAPDQARAVIEEELHAASRAVARSARLAIRLAPGVKLIDVIGSQRLDSGGAQRVRDIEQSLDRKLSHQLGIKADRGEDEDGIQIVIPGIFAGDRLVILVDVVVAGPGPVAEVTLRYKDLVYLRNGALHGQLSLPTGKPVQGPVERVVSKNLLAHRFSEAVRQAADALGRGDRGEAAALLQNMLDVLNRARQQVPAWENDSALINDQNVLERYLEALASPQAGDWQSRFEDSLRLAAWRKSHRPPKEWP